MARSPWTRTAAALALLLGSSILGPAAVAKTPAGGDAPINDEARQRFKIGVTLLQDPAGPRYEEAYGNFKAAYASSPSSKILGNLGLCAMNLERDGEAIDAYTRYLADVADIKPAERATIAQDLEVLKAGVVRVKLVATPPEAAVLDERVPVNGARIANRYQLAGGKAELRLHPGQHRITIRLAGYRDEVWELEAPPGSSHERSVTLTPAGAAPAATGTGTSVAPPVAPPTTPSTEPERPVPASVWVTLVATGALAIGAGVVGGLALSNHGEFQDALDAGDYANAQSLKDSGQGLNIATDVLIATASAAAVVTLILYLTRPEEETGTTPATAVSVAPIAGPRSAGASLSVVF